RAKSVVKSAEAGQLRIVCSALALTEVLRIKSEPVKLPAETEPTIRAFFKNPYIIVRNVDRRVGEYARELIWQYNIPTKDAIHVATGLLTEGVVQLGTFDTDDLIKHSGKIGSPPLTIAWPPLLQWQPSIEDHVGG